METSRASANTRVYRARRREHTVLYRALAHHFERFLLLYEERFQPTRGYLRGCVEPRSIATSTVGSSYHGVAQVRCPDCRHELPVAFSCKLRSLCPSYQQAHPLGTPPTPLRWLAAPKGYPTNMVVTP